MHTGHIILVKADDYEDAISSVYCRINDDESWFASNWSDWASVEKDSRWEMADFFPKGYTGSNKYVVSYETEKELFEELVESCLDARRAEFVRLADELDLAGKSVLTDFDIDEDTMLTWKLRQFANLANSVYCPESKIFDLENYDANLNWFRQDVAEGNNNWFAVVADFHY